MQFTKCRSVGHHSEYRQLGVIPGTLALLMIMQEIDDLVHTVGQKWDAKITRLQAYNTYKISLETNISIQQQHLRGW